jgi:hypothetical protein
MVSTQPTQTVAVEWRLTAKSQASEARLYTFSPETKTALRKFRLGTSRAKDPQAVICKQRTFWKTSPQPQHLHIVRQKEREEHNKSLGTRDIHTTRGRRPNPAQETRQEEQP